ncbi:hypothetical protein [Glutamicibacter soli]|uniref:hypothetical protein n=1 Tax=Glutamicibacter soli TaxID=453836 RepID=UPI003FCF486A
MAIGKAAHNATLREVLFQMESKISLTAPAHLWGSREGMREMKLRALADHERLVQVINTWSRLAPADPNTLVTAWAMSLAASMRRLFCA